MSLNPSIKEWAGLRVWIIGASTGIGEALARQLAVLGARLCISARSRDTLEILSRDLPGSRVAAFDMTDTPTVAGAAQVLFEAWGGVDVVVVMAGTYVEMRAQNFELQAAKRQIDVNVNGVLNILASVLPRLIQQKQGHLSIVSSVAGYRGLPNSLVYGASKAALINMAESLYMDLKNDGVAVSIVEPGFVDTPLTKNNRFPMPCLITPQRAASEMIEAYARGDFNIHFPKAFTRTLRFLRLLPCRLYFPLVKKFTKM